jgi:hypothetical protein
MAKIPARPQQSSTSTKTAYTGIGGCDLATEGVCEASNAQDALMIGKTSRAVAMKYARPTTPKTANTAKDTFSTVMPSFGLMGSVFHFSDQQ